MYNYKIIDNDYVIFEIPKDNEIIEVLVDIDDYQKIKNRYWHTHWREDLNNHYVASNRYIGVFNGKVKSQTIYLHNYIMKPPKGMVVDHINHNTIDNRKSNLRLVNMSDNAKNRKGRNINNTTGYRNVSYDKTNKTYVVQLQINGKNKVFGRFKDVHEAGRVAREMREKYYGEYAGKG